MHPCGRCQSSGRELVVRSAILAVLRVPDIVITEPSSAGLLLLCTAKSRGSGPRLRLFIPQAEAVGRLKPLRTAWLGSACTGPACTAFGLEAGLSKH